MKHKTLMGHAHPFLDPNGFQPITRRHVIESTFNLGEHIYTKRAFVKFQRHPNTSGTSLAHLALLERNTGVDT